MAKYLPSQQSAWNGRVDGEAQNVLRWHQVLQCIDLANETLPIIKEHQQGICIIGFCSDAGVKRNKGRIGAAKGPEAIRHACVNFPVIASHIALIDAGDVWCDDADLEAAQQLLGDKIKQIKLADYLPIVLGGGHELAFANFNGLIPFNAGQEFGIVNFDAHFDLRVVEPSTGATSGTGIWQIKEYCDATNTPLHYLPMGIQQYCNTRQLFATAKAMDTIYFLAEDFCEKKVEKMMQVINGLISNADVLQLTIDMDVFAAAFAPGVSAPSFNGILPNSLFKKMIRHIILSGKVATVDIAETNPLFDIDERTVRLAASIVFDIVQAADVNAEFL